jgi:PiT family inorganic phosphate transporter
MRLGTVQECGSGDDGAIRGINAQTAVDTLHYLSAGAVCFSRAVNDTPKIAALLLVLGHLDKYIALGSVALAMALGGVLQSRRIADTMGKRITDLNPGQGLCANLVTALLVLFASRLGVPVSTTHVSCGAIFGIGVVERNAHWKTITAVLATWLTTLPLAALVGAALSRLLANGATAPA